MERRYPQLPPLPPHCPNPHCEHYLAPLEQSWFTPHGSYPTAVFGTVPRFRCRSCGKTFSTQTFSLDYYAKKKVDYKRLLMHLVTSSGVLDMSRFFHLRAETITNRFERLARIALAVHSDLLKELPFGEDLAADGLESFTSSQFYPCHINCFVGSASQLIYSSGFSPLRRKGRMTEEQRARRAVLEKAGKAEPKAVENSFRTLTADMVQRIAEKGDGAHAGKRRLFTDEHRAYPRAFARVKGFREVFCHTPVSSRAPRTTSCVLFPVNYIDRQYRKDLSDHARETVQFAKCPSAMMGRAVVYRMYHNVISPWRVKKSRRGDWRTHAEAAGVSRQAVREILERRWGRRPFWGSVSVNREEENTWFCRWRNPGQKSGKRLPHYIRS